VTRPDSRLVEDKTEKGAATTRVRGISANKDGDGMKFGRGR
jgi:hypothetical protein